MSKTQPGGSAPPTPPEPRHASFLETVAQLRKGATIADLDEQLTELAQAVRDTGKPGELSITLRIAPAIKGEKGKDGDSLAIAVQDAIKCKRPQPERGSSIFYATSFGEIARTDERQLELPEEPAAAPKELAPEPKAEVRDFPRSAATSPKAV